MNEPEMTRGKFLRGGCSLAAATVVSGMVPVQTLSAERLGQPALPPDGKMLEPGGVLAVRPYQLLCLVCAFGEDPAGPRQGRLKDLLSVIRKNPDVPLSLRCNAGDVFTFQDPGIGEDSPEGGLFNRKRDLDILQRMSWLPSTTLPARTLLQCLLKHITMVNGICGYDSVTAPDWRGCPKAKSGYYEQGCQRGIQAIVPPRTGEEMATEKARSLEVMNSAEVVTSRPHILLCAVCQYGSGVRPPFKPDNLPDLMDLIFNKHRNLSIRLAEGADWMMCAPCPYRARNNCVNVLGAGGLSNQKRDLDMLQKLGLRYGSTMNAQSLFRLIFAKIPTTREICKREGNTSPCVWWDSCGESSAAKSNVNYEKGRKELLEKL